MAEPYKTSIRYVLCWLAMFGFMLVYVLRVNMSIAIVAMTDNTTSPNSTHYDWNEKQKGEILGAFFYGYVASQILGGYIADKFEVPATIFGYGVAGTAIFTAFTPVAARWGISWLCALRVLEGVCEGVTVPAITSFWGKWAPPEERSRLQGWSLNGCVLGSVIGLTSTAFFSTIQAWGWESSFYIFSFVSLFWCWLWFIIASDTPALNDWISLYERNYIEMSLRAHNPSNSHPGPFPVRAAMTSGPVWALIGAHFCYGWALYTMMNDLPLYLHEVLHLDVAKTAIYSALPPLLCWSMGLVVPMLADKLMEFYSRTTVRKIMQNGCFIGTALTVSVLGCIVGINQWLALVLLCLSSIFTSLEKAGVDCAHLDMAAPFAGTLFGITNTFGNLPGFMVPLFAGIFVENCVDKEQAWMFVWIMNGFINFTGAVIFGLFANMELQPWAAPNLDIRSRLGSGDSAREEGILDGGIPTIEDIREEATVADDEPLIH